MISVEKRRSSRKSGKHRKRSDTSSGGSFLDETDREVSSLTDRAFKSLCIGDEAVYNDSHLGLPSSSTHIDRQLAFAQGEPFRDEEEREELKRAAHQNFSLRVQQYGQDWVHEGMYGTSTHKDPEWGIYGDRTQGRVSATFQNSFVETSQQGMSLREEELSFISNRATELSLQHHRSRSRVSSLIRTFNSANTNDQFRGCNEESSWDKSALMNIHNEFSDFSSFYQQNLNSSTNFPSAGPFSCRDANFYGSDMAAAAHMSHNSVSSFMRSSHNELSMSAQSNCNSHFFIHSEFSPFKVWREHNRFPFQEREVSGFVHCSQFPKWYETPMFKELSLENQLQGPYRGMRHSSSNLAPRAPSNPTHFTSMSLMQQKASAVEKRSESELAGHYPQRRRTQSLGTNKLPSQRPSTASPTVEMSRRVRDTISSVKALQQKIKLMSQQNISAGMITTQQETFRNHNSFHYGNNAAPNMVSSDISATPFTISQLPTPSVTAHQEENTSGFQQNEASPQPVEHPPVRAESRGVTPDARLSSYKSRATSLLFNLKDNRKRVKSTYSPTKFKGLDKQEKNQQPPCQEPRETVKDVPDCLDPDFQFMQQENPRSPIMAANQYQNPSLTLQTQLERVNTGQYLENTPTDYQTAQVQGEMVCHSGFSGFIPGNYTSNQLTNGQNRHEYLASFTPYKQGGRDNIQLQEGLQHPHAAVDTTRLNVDRSQGKDSLIRTAEAEKALTEPIGKVITERGRYENFQEINDYHNTSSNGNWQNCKDTEKVGLKVAASPLKQDPVHLMERQENQRNVHKAAENAEPKDTLSFRSSSYKSASLVRNNFFNQPNAEKEQNVQDMRDDVALNYNKHTNQDHNRPNTLNPTTDKAKPNAVQIKTHTALMAEDEKQSLQQPKSGQEKSSVYTDNTSEFMMANPMNHTELDEAKGEEAMAEHKRAKHGKAQMAAAQQRANAEQPKAESSRLILTGQTDSETDKTDSKMEATKAETPKQTSMKKEESKGELKEETREKSIGEHTAEQTKAWMSMDEYTGVLGKVEDTERKQPFKREQEKTEKPEEKQKLTQMADIEIERIKEGRTAQETDKTNHPEQAETEQIRKEQAESERIKTEQVTTEKIQVEEAETKCKTTKKTEQTDDQNNKTKQTETEEEDSGGVTHVVSKTEKDSIVSRQLNVEKCDFKDTKPEERKAEQLKQEERKVELSKAELLKTENLLEKSAKLTAKLVATQQVRNESDKVEHVKTELAKAKAELAKIKEKMRGEQKEKVSNNAIVREDETLKNNYSSSVDAVKKFEQKTEDQAVELKTDRIPDDYELLREKYGFIHGTSTLKNNPSASESALGPVSEAQIEQIKAGNNEDSKNVPSPASTFLKSNTQNTKEVINFRENEATEGHVDNKSSKETPNVKSSIMNEYERANEEDVEKKQNIDSKIDNISSQSNLELAKPHLHDGKPNLTDHSKSAGKEPQIAFPKMLSYKEKAQTKQEILTSKIKAHAEKEISALKEKGFSSKNSSKQLVGSQSFHARQKPLSQDAPKRHEGAVSNYVSPKHPLESSGIKTEPEFGITTIQSVEKPRKTNPTANNTKTTESSDKKHAEVKSSMQNSEQKSKIDQQKQQENQREATKKQSEEVKECKRFEDLTQAAESKPLTLKNSEREEMTHKDSQPPNTALGRADLHEANDSLQIMGIMVTVREGKPPQTIDERINADGRQMKFTKKEDNVSELDKRHFSPGSEGNMCSKEINSVKAVEGQKPHSTMSESLAKNVESIDPEALKETVSMETKDINVARAGIGKTMNPQEGNSTQQILPKQVPQADVMKGTQLIKTDAEKSKEQTALGNSDFISKVVTSGTDCHHNDADISLKKVTEEVDSSVGLKCSNIDVQIASSSKESKHDSAKLFSNASLTGRSTEHENKPLPPDLQNKETDIRDNSQGDDNLHIDSIAIRVVPAVTENDKRDIVEKPLNAEIPFSTGFATEKHQTTASGSKANDEQCSEDASPASSEHRMKESLENNLAVQQVLSSVRKLSDLLKMNGKVSNLNVVSEAAEAKAESNVELKELDYFQVQGQVEANNVAENNCTTVEATPKKSELQDTPPNKTASIEDSPKDGKSEVFVFSVDHCLKNEDLISEKYQDDSIKRNKLEAVDTPASKVNTSSFEPCNNEGKVNVGQANHIEKNPSENTCSLSTTDKENSRPFPQTKAEKVTAKPDVKPKPRDKISTIPEISAIADYARLKVIVSEDRELNTAHDFPPSKKEGFFPLIRGHRSRRPVFTTDTQGSSVKEKSSSTKTDVSAKVSTEPKATIFPITEREHQRTGMFKLGDKDKQEKMLLETDRTLSAQKKQTSEDEIRAINQKTGQSNSSSAVSGQTSKDLTNLDKSLPSQAALRERHHTKENITYQRKDESPENQQNMNIHLEGVRSDQLKKERLVSQGEDNKMRKLDIGKQLQEELMVGNDNRKSNVRIKHIIEESRASLAEEERRAAQREEEKRAKEREAVAQMIKERREQQRQADKKPEEDKKAKQTEDKITDQNTKDFQTQTKETIRITENKNCRFGNQEQLRRTSTEQQWRNTQEEQNQTAAREQPVEQQIKRESDTEEKRIIQGKQQQVEQQSKLLQKEHQQRTAEEQQSRSINKEKKKRAEEEQKTRFTQEEKQIVAVEQQPMRFAKEEDRRAVEKHQKELVQTKQQKIAADEQQRNFFQVEQLRKAAEEKEMRQNRTGKNRKVLEEQQRKTTSEELLRGSTEKQQWKTAQEEQQNRIVKEEGIRLNQDGQQKRRSAEEQQRQLSQKEQQKGEVDVQKWRRVQEGQQRRVEEEKQMSYIQDEQHRMPAEQHRKLFQEEQQRKAAEEQQRKLFQEEQQRKAAEEQQRKLFQEEQQRKAAEEHQRKLFQGEQQRRAAEEQQRKFFQEEQQRKAAEEQQRKLFQEEQQRKAAEEQQRKLFQEEQQRKAAEEQQRKLFQEEQQRKVAEEQQRKRFQEEQQRREAEEQQRKLFQEEQQRMAAEEQQRKLFQEEQQRMAAEEQERKRFQEEQQKRAKDEQQSRHFQEEKQRWTEKEQQVRLLQEKQQIKAAEEHQKITTERRQANSFQEEQGRGATVGQEKSIALEDKQQRTIEKHQRTPQQKIFAKGDEHSRVAEQINESTCSKKVYKKEQQTDENAVCFSDMGIQQMPKQEKEEQHIEKLRRRRSLNHTLMITPKEEGVMAVDGEEITLKPEEKLVKDQSVKPLEKKRMAEDLIREKSKKMEENLFINREKTGVTQAEIQKQTQKTDGIQYYAFTSADMEVKSREKQLSSLLHSEQRSSPVRLDSPNESIFQAKSHRPLAPASPALSLPRSNTSSPALGTKPSMFKVKDNTIRGSSFIKSVKPRFHKNFGEDFLMASPLDRSLEKGDDEREKIRSGAGTPVHPEIGMKRFPANTEFSTLLSSSSGQEYSLSHHRPYSRRSIALDDDESRSVVSNLSEDVESYATSAADVGDVRGLFDFERPESACSFSSDVSRSLGKPPVVPPKTEKALRRAQRLTSRRMKKELSKVAAGGDKETSSVPSSSSTETHQSNNDVVASPHFSQPVSLPHAPVLGSTLPSSNSECQSVLRSFHSSPHATGPISVPTLSNATSSVSIPTVSPHTPGTVSQPAAPKTVPNAPSSSTLHHANHPTPVAQYHVESNCFSQSYPMTQRKVLQDLGSGQYYVVDVPVQVQTKTFFDPETGKYVQLNVRESGQSISRPHIQQTQPHQIKLQPQPLTQTPAAGKPFVLYQRYHSYPQNYQPTAIAPVRRSRSSAPGSLQPTTHESLSESRSYGNMASEVEQNSVEPCYSPERTPYMDTVIDTDKTHNSVKSTQNPMESASECGTKSQTDGRSVHENHETSFQYQGRDIITMSELEDFMEATEA